MTTTNQEQTAEIAALRNRMYAARDKLYLAQKALKEAEHRRDALAMHFRNTTVAEKRITVLKARATDAHYEMHNAVALLCKAEEPHRPRQKGSTDGTFIR